MVLAPSGWFFQNKRRTWPETAGFAFKLGGTFIVQPYGPKASAKTNQNLGACFGDFQQPQAFAQGARQLGLGRVERAGQGNQAAQAGQYGWRMSSNKTDLRKL